MNILVDFLLKINKDIKIKKNNIEKLKKKS